jgi:hypothetical protein
MMRISPHKSTPIYLRRVHNSLAKAYSVRIENKIPADHVSIPTCVSAVTKNNLLCQSVISQLCVSTYDHIRVRSTVAFEVYAVCGHGSVILFRVLTISRTDNIEHMKNYIQIERNAKIEFDNVNATYSSILRT